MISIAALVLALVPYLAMSSDKARNRLQKYCRDGWHIALALAVLLVPFLLCTIPMAGRSPAGFVANLLEMVCYVSLPAVALLHRPSAQKPLGVTDILVILFVALPVKFHALPPFPVPADSGSLDVSLVSLLTAINAALFLFLVVRPVAGIGYTFRLKASDFATAVLGVGAYTAVAVPLGMSIGFIAYAPKFLGAPVVILQWLTIYFTTAIPEELLFRGLIQNLLKDRLGSSQGALVLASMIFGLTHVNKVTAGHGAPNFEYVLMATLAGLAYGWVWQRTSKISASAMTHATVNCVWHALLSG